MGIGLGFLDRNVSFDEVSKEGPKSVQNVSKIVKMAKNGVFATSYGD